MSESEEMYLITIASLQEAVGEENKPIPLSLLASELSVVPASANQMIRKLEETGMVEYLPYKGARLTTRGKVQALNVLRLRRLWEVFLVDKLHLTLQEADDLACRLEHITPQDVSDRLDEFLGKPHTSPQGKIIPLTSGHNYRTEVPLAGQPAGGTFTITRLEGCQATQAFLSSAGLRPGETIHIEGVAANGVLLVEAANTRLALDVHAAGAIFIERKN